MVYESYLVLWVVDHGWFPFSVHLVIPVFGLGGFRVSDVFWLVPVFRLGVGRVVDHLAVVPILWLLRFRVLDLFRRQKVPVLFQFSRLDLNILEILASHILEVFNYDFPTFSYRQMSWRPGVYETIGRFLCTYLYTIPEHAQV